MDIPYEVDWVSRNVVNVRCDFQKKESYEFLLTTDVHWDNAHSDQSMFRRHLEEAKKRGAGIIDNGDLFCLMQGKWDPRSDQTNLRKEHRGNNYLDLVGDGLAEFLGPYSENFISIGIGNHEKNVLDRHGHDVTTILCAKLRERNRAVVRNHWYSGWILFRCRRGPGGQGQTIRLFRHHGYGGGGPVTRDTIKTNRLSLQYPDADIVFTGHTHDDWVLNLPRLRITERGRIHHDIQTHIKAPGYKDGIRDGAEGFEVEKGHNIKSKGAVWLRLFRGDNHNGRWLVETRFAK